MRRAQLSLGRVGLATASICAVTTEQLLPGEDGPLPRRFGGRPVSDVEALGVARRLARRASEGDRVKGKLAEVPEVLPPVADLTVSAYRLPTVTIYRVRARAELEGRRVTDVVRELLEGYGAAAPGTVAKWELPSGE